MYIPSSSFVYLCFSLDCDACLKSSVLRVGVKMLHNTHLLHQPLRWCCAECAVHHERNVLEEQHHIYVARTNDNRVRMACEHCCLLP